MLVKSGPCTLYICAAIKPNLSYLFQMKKVPFFAVVAIASTFFLASCGNAPAEAPAEETVVEEAAPVEEVVEEVADTTATEAAAE